MSMLPPGVTLRAGAPRSTGDTYRTWTVCLDNRDIGELGHDPDLRRWYWDGVQSYGHADTRKEALRQIVAANPARR